MASVKVEDVQNLKTEVHTVDRQAEAIGKSKPYKTTSNTLTLLSYDAEFTALIGQSPSHSLLLTTANTNKNPFFHEGIVYLPEHDELYMTSNFLSTTSTSTRPTILISHIKLSRSTESMTAVEWFKLRPPPGIDMPNGATNYTDSGVLFCAQGLHKYGTGGIYLLPRSAPPRAMITNFHGRTFNSPNDIVVSRKDGAIWFTDPCYGYEQDFRPKPQLPNHVYRFEASTGIVRVVADGLVKPNGIALDLDETTCYITDTGFGAGDGTEDPLLPATIYAYDVDAYHGAPMLVNRRVFAYADNGVPDGLKTDVKGNVYAGCGDGVHVWNKMGVLIGKIVVPAGHVANFCFGKRGEMFVCNETRLWRVVLGDEVMGTILAERTESL